MSTDRNKLEKPGARLIVEEEKASGSVKLKTYWQYFKKCGGRHIAFVTLFIFAVT